MRSDLNSHPCCDDSTEIHIKGIEGQWIEMIY